MPVDGIEPPTPKLKTWCSTTEPNRLGGFATTDRSAYAESIPLQVTKP